MVKFNKRNIINENSRIISKQAQGLDLGKVYQTVCPLTEEFLLCLFCVKSETTSMNDTNRKTMAVMDSTTESM